MISGLKDKLIPPMMMQQLRDSAKNAYVEYVEIPEGSHKKTWNLFTYSHNEYFKAFIERSTQSQIQ